MTVVAVAIALVVGLVLFALTLLVVTFSSAWVADVTGHFRTLFVLQPHSRAFRIVRWVIAGLVTLGTIDAVVLESLL